MGSFPQGKIVSLKPSKNQLDPLLLFACQLVYSGTVNEERWGTGRSGWFKMPKLNNDNSKCHVFTFYEGPRLVAGNKVLFTLGYDLKFVLTHFEILSLHKGRSIKGQLTEPALRW